MNKGGIQLLILFFSYTNLNLPLLSTSEKTKYTDGKSDMLWNAMFEILKEFKAEHGHALVPGTYKKMPPNYEGTLTLSKWLAR